MIEVLAQNVSAKGFRFHQNKIKSSAHDFAKKLYENEPPRRSGESAFSHPLAVAENFSDPTLYAAAICHDIPENFGRRKLASIFILFGKEVFEIVETLTRKPLPKFENKILNFFRNIFEFFNYLFYIFRILKNKKAREIKKVDLRVNLSDGLAHHPFRYRVALGILRARFSFSF
jgi:hypothetical protein